MFPKEFHIFVLVTTIVYYMMLKSFKKNIQSKMTKKLSKRPRRNKKRQQENNFIYVIFLPVMLYLGGYVLLYNTNHSMLTNLQVYNPLSSDSLLSAPYPESVMS